MRSVCRSNMQPDLQVGGTEQSGHKKYCRNDSKEVRGFMSSTKIRRLGWAGIELEAPGGETAVVDLFRDKSALLSLRDPNESFPSPSQSGRTRAALVTHLHHDHADPKAIAAALAPGGIVLRPEPAQGTEEEVVWTSRAEKGFCECGLTPRIVSEWERIEIEPFRVVAVPAVDGIGDPQLSWVIEVGGKRIFHGGDTIFHGAWWLIARRCGPFDAAFLPINSPVLNFAHLQPPSPLGTAMDPQEAAVAAKILRARLAIPIHYASLNKPGVYTEVDRPAEAFHIFANANNVEAKFLAPGDWIEL